MAKSNQAPKKQAIASAPADEEQVQPASRWIPAAVLILVVLFAVGGYSALWGGVRLAGIRVSDSSLQAKLTQKIATYKTKTLTFSSNGSQYKVAVASLRATYDIQASIDAAKNDHSLWHKFFGHEVPLNAVYEQNSWTQTILGWSSSINTPVSNAAVRISGSGPVLTPATVGTRLDFGVSSLRLSEALGALSTDPTPLATYTQAPLVTDAQLQAVWPKVKEWLSGPVTLTDAISGQFQQLSEAQIAKLVSVRNAADSSIFVADPSDLSELPLRYALSSGGRLAQPGEAVASLDSTALQSVADQYAPQYSIDPVDAQLSFNGSALTVTTPSKIGQELNEAVFVQRLTSALSSSERTVQLPIETVQPDVREDNLASLGITQLIGHGTSNWGLSPTNRIHNIETGVSRFKSVLVKPGENFSFNKVLGPVDASTGFLPELSILADRTVPEFGGGLCQVSTTAWRAALNAGLPIISRTNHAYPVSYYFPIGTDATIYLPYPDMSWKNNTGHYILIQAYTQKNNVFFDYYGSLPAGTVVNFSRNANMSAPVTDVVKLPNYVFNQKPDGSEDTIFYRQVLVNGQISRTDHFFTHYQSAKLFPHVAQ